MKTGLYCTCMQGRQEGWTNIGVAEEWWVHSACHRPSKEWVKGTDPAMLNFFKGGPLDGCAYETTALLTEDGLTVPIQHYVWTPEVVTSATTGRSARVWLHSALANSAVVELNSNAAVSKNDAGGSDVKTDVTGGHNVMSDATLEERRKALKLSRQQVADKAGLTPAKVYRIEKGGNRTTDEETAQVAAALDALAGEAAPAADPA